MFSANPSSDVPTDRVRSGHAGQQHAPRPEGLWVLYWMTAARRSRFNYALERAVDWARELGKPLVVLEALRVDYRWASDRMHACVLQGMRDNDDAFAKRPGVVYHPYIERASGEGSGLIHRLARDAAVVVGDDYPCFFLPAVSRAAARGITCRYELVDSNGLYPMRSAPKVFARAFDFRRHLQKELPPHLEVLPRENPLRGARLVDLKALPREIVERWPRATGNELGDPRPLLAGLPIDHGVPPVAEQTGPVAAGEMLDRFLNQRLEIYGERRNQPEEQAASELSACLHWGHLSAHEVFGAVARREGWTPDRLSTKANGSSKGWWGVAPSAESFLDELITWRELGFNMASRRRDYDRFESLPDWAQKTLREHADDPREHVYSLAEFEHAETHDSLWNAAQRQLLSEGRIHNYLRMLWGKKVLEWSATPRGALATLIELNNKYAIDGRDPNSYSGIFWVLGRYDRAWGPERPIYGKIRYMSSENTARKVRVRDYVERYAAPQRRLFQD